MRSVFSCFLFLYFFFTPVVFAKQSCNTNLHCRGSWICVGGTADNGDSNFTGYCKPNIIMRQVCLIYNLATGVFGKAITLLAIAAFGGKFLVNVGDAGRVSWHELLALIIGVAFIFGAPQIINLITKDSVPFCDFSRE